MKQIVLRKSYFIKKQSYEQAAKLRDFETRVRVQIADLAKTQGIDPSSVLEDETNDDTNSERLFGHGTNRRLLAKLQFKSKQPPMWPETLLLEWEQLAQPATSETYRRVRAKFLVQFRLLSYITDIDADVNVDVIDVRNVLRQASSLRIGSAVSSGPDRAIGLPQPF